MCCRIPSLPTKFFLRKRFFPSMCWMSNVGFWVMLRFVCNFWDRFLMGFESFLSCVLCYEAYCFGLVVR